MTLNSEAIAEVAISTGERGKKARFAIGDIREKLPKISTKIGIVKTITLKLVTREKTMAL